MKSKLLGFYGDDFSGSTDVLEVLAQAGLRTRLYLDAQAIADDTDAAKLQAVGVAGISRSLPTAEIGDEVAPVLTALASHCEAVHYKTCSTFDSSPQTGSIGRVIDVGRAHLGVGRVAIVIGAPALSRYCVFGNLFATSGTNSPIYRLDRHPTMSRHPITPMAEADLARHLRCQTRASIANINVLELDAAAATNTPLHCDTEAEIVLLDTLTRGHLITIGQYLWETARNENDRFWVGSSGVEYALTAYWHHSSVIPTQSPGGRLTPTAPLLVVSGSCSPVTAGQIEAAISAGFIDVPIQPESWLDSSNHAALIRRVVGQLHSQRNVIVHAARGPDDPRIAEVETRLKSQGRQHERNRCLGMLLANIVRQALDANCVRRVAVAGGDTSGYVAKQLGIVSLDFVAPLAPGSPLCLARGKHAAFELTFKGGQVGGADFFVRVLG